MVISTKKAPGKQNKAELGRLVSKRYEIQAQMRSLEKDLKNVNMQLSQFVQESGTVDAKGSSNYRYENYALQYQARTQISVNTDLAIELLSERKILKKYSRPLVTKEDIIRALEDGAINKAEAKSLLEKKVSHAFVVSEIKEEDEEEQA